uniref:interleukin-22 receptor subunit alpha-2 n=1 Tax=Centroberyx gerrardi TaxID=166262 RepID=UPI003AADFA2A
MTCLLLGASLLGSLSVCLTEQVPVFLAPPVKVRFNSVDYENILHWTPPSNNTSVQYDVQWKIYGETQWLDVEGCQGIHKHHCDLSSLTSDLREWYYARVHACSLPSSRSAWALSPRFSPRWNTKISAPAVRLNATEKGIVVHVKPPRSLAQKMQNRLCCKVYLIHTSGEEEVFEIDCSSKRLILNELNHETKYCLQAQTLIPLQGKSSERSFPKCATTL